MIEIIRIYITKKLRQRIALLCANDFFYIDSYIKKDCEKLCQYKRLFYDF